jgi:hypothetical protein
VFLEVYPQVLGVSTLKRCSKCKELKPRDDFNKCQSNKDGLQYSCRDCHNLTLRQRRISDPEGTKLRAKEKYHKDSRARDYSREYMKKWRENNPEKAKDHTRKWREKNRDHIKEKNVEYRASHSDELREYDRNRGKARRSDPSYKAKAKVYKLRRRSLERGATGTFSREEFELLQRAQTDRHGRLRCWWCGKPIKGTPHLDHKHPISRGGTGNIGNLALSCQTCNQSKNAKTPAEWRGRLL